MNRLKSHFSRKSAAASAAALALLPTLAAAHPGHYHPPGEDDEFDAFTAGLLHPVSGLDHLLLALAVGWLFFSVSRSRAALPAAFLGSLAIGAWTGIGLRGGAFLEIAIACTLLAAGAAIISAKYLKAAPVAAALCVAGAIHGFAHGSEAASNISFPSYGAGFLIGTALLVGLGAVVHLLAARSGGPLAPRIAGIGLLAAGTASLIHAL